MSLDARYFDKPIAFHRIFVQFGGVKVALFLSQAMYWTNRIESGRDGWFYKTRTEWGDETGLTREEQEGARKKLRDLGILEEKLVGLPAQLWYRVNLETLGTLLQTSWLETTPPVGGKAANRQAGKPPTFTETTTEITSETTPSFQARPAVEAPVVGHENQPNGSYEQFIACFNRGKWRHANPAATAPKRKADFRSRMKDPWWKAHYMEGLARAYESDFLTGRASGQWAGKGMDLEFFLRPNTLAYILEGKYDNPVGNKPSTAKWNPVD